MLTRRNLCAGLVALAAVFVLPSRETFAESSGAAAFIQGTANQLLTAMKSAGTLNARKQVLQPIVDKAVDVDGIAKFCLGRFWRIATPAQQQEYLALFHRTLLNSITARLGDYQDVTFTVGRSVALNGDTTVDTTINSAGKPPVQVQWVVESAPGGFKVVDLLAEGTSLRQTQRSDYTSFLDGHGGNVQTLLDALKRQEA